MLFHNITVILEETSFKNMKFHVHSLNTVILQILPFKWAYKCLKNLHWIFPLQPWGAWEEYADKINSKQKENIYMIKDCSVECRLIFD